MTKAEKRVYEAAMKYYGRWGKFVFRHAWSTSVEYKLARACEAAAKEKRK